MTSSRMKVYERKTLGIVVMSLLLAGIIGSLVSGLDSIKWSGLEFLYLLLLGLLCITPFVVQMARGTFELFHPLNYVILYIFLNYAVGVTVMLINSDVARFDFTLRSQLPQTLALAGIGVLAALIGGAWIDRWAAPRIMPAIEKRLTSYRDHSVIFWLSLIGLLITFLLFFLWAIFANVPLSQLNTLDSGVRYGTIQRTEGSILYLFFFKISWPILLLLATIYAPNQGTKRLILFLWVAAIAVHVASGSRSQAFTIVGAPIVYYYLSRKRRPSLFTILMTLVLLVGISGLLVLARGVNASSGQGASAERLAGEAVAEITDRGTAVGTMISTLVFPRKHPHLGVDLFEAVTVTAIPRVLWPDKPISPRAVQSTLWEYVEVAIPGMGLDTIGEFYGGFGWMGAFVAMFMHGALASLVFAIWRGDPDDRLRCVLLAMWLPFQWLVFSRGNVSFFLIRAAYILGPGLLVWYLSTYVRISNRTSSSLARRERVTG